MTGPNPTKSEIFTQYNKARAAAKKGLLDPKRVNRALGLIQSKDVRSYVTTTGSCTCPDFQRGNNCKHLIRRWMEVRIEQRRAARIVKASQLLPPKGGSL